MNSFPPTAKSEQTDYRPVLIDRSRDEVASLIEPLGLNIAIETKVDNEGLKIEFQGADGVA